MPGTFLVIDVDITLEVAGRRQEEGAVRMSIIESAVHRKVLPTGSGDGVYAFD